MSPPLSVPDPARTNLFTKEQWGLFADMAESLGADIDKRVQWVATVLLHASDRLAGLHAEVVALRMVLARHGVVADAEVEAAINEVRAGFAVESAMDPKLAELAEGDRAFRETLHRLLQGDSIVGRLLPRTPEDEA